jgi:hypothetical protein
VFIDAMKKMWSSIGVYAEGAKPVSEASAALWTLARALYLSLPAAEITTAREMAEKSKLLQRFGAEVVKTGEGTIIEEWGGGWDSGQGGWTGVFAGFGALRDDLINAAAADRKIAVAAAFDQIASDTTARKALVKNWQKVMQTAGRYAGTIDGLWGPKSETAFVTLLPLTYGQPTTLGAIKALRAYYPEITDAESVAVAISRDRWVSANPDKLPPNPIPPDVVTTTPTTTEESTEESTEETLLVTPEETPIPIGDGTAATGSGATTMVVGQADGTQTTVTALEEKTARGRSPWPWLIGGLGLFAVAVIATGNGEAKE